MHEGHVAPEHHLKCLTRQDAVYSFHSYDEMHFIAFRTWFQYNLKFYSMSVQYVEGRTLL